MNAASLLSELGTLMGVGGLQFDEQGCARLVFDGALVLNLEHEEGSSRLQIYSVIGKVPLENREHVYQLLLEGNLFGAETGGAVLAIDALDREIILFKTLEGDGITGAVFAEVVGRFVDAVEEWTARLANAGTSAPAAGQETAYEGLASSMIRA